MEVNVRIARKPIPDGKGSNLWFDPAIYTGKINKESPDPCWKNMDILLDGELVVQNVSIEKWLPPLHNNSRKEIRFAMANALADFIKQKKLHEKFH